MHITKFKASMFKSPTMKKIKCLLYMMFLCLLAQAQDFEKDLLEKINIRNIGPAGMSGRVTAIDVVLSDQDKIYIGSASGGVWLSENGGISWKPIFDEAATQSIGSIKINQNNPDEIWVGTGEGNPRNSHNSGAGIYKSIDGGKTWELMGLEKTKIIHRIVINKDNPDIVYAGAMGSAWGDSKHRGVYQTTNGGKTWDKILYVDERTGVADMIVDPVNPNKIFVAMWDFRRTPWDFVSGGEGSGLYHTLDGGKNWTRAEEDDGMPKGILGRIGIAQSKSKPNILYALIEAKENGLYKSTDGGKKWNLVSTKNIGNRPFYYAELYVDPQNENRIFNIYTYVSRSEDGGKTFKTIADYGNSVHPDHHAFWISPDNPEYIIDGNDGGLNISRDGGDTWRFVENLPIGQFYHVNVDNDFPYNVYGGMQDNGSWAGPGFALKAGGITNSDWQELYFGDGFDVSPLPSDSRYGYAMSQGGNVAFYDRVTGHNKFVKPVIEDTLRLRYHWNAAIAQDPFNDCGVYFGSQFVHYSKDCGESWETISPDLTTNNPEKQKQDKSGGLTLDATFAENHTTILCIEPNPNKEGEIWVGTDDGRLQHSVNGGQNWTDVYSKLPGAPANGWIAQVKVSKINADELFVVINNYRTNDWSAYLYHSNNGGASFRRIVNDRNVDGFVCSVLQDPENENLIFLGTDVGLYFSLDHGSNWTKWPKGFPSVQVRDLAFNQAHDDLVIGTFGRAFWVLDDVETLRALSDDNSLIDKDLAILSAAEGYQVSYRSYQGVRFVAQGDFSGDNKSMSAAIPVWKKPKSKDEMKDKPAGKKGKKGKKKKGGKDDEMKDKKGDGKGKDKGKDGKKKTKVYVIDSVGDTIRTLSPKLKDGLNYVYWGLDQKGERGPSRSDRSGPFSDREPGGVTAVPGTYKVVLEDGQMKDSTTVEVKFDPRREVSQSDLAKKAETQKAYNKKVKAVKQSFDQLKEAKKTIKLVDNMMINQVDSTKQEITKLGKTLNSKIDSLMNLFNDPEGLKGIQRNPNTVSAQMWPTRNYINASDGAPTANAQTQIDKFHNKASDAIDAVNQFFASEWQDYQAKVKAIPPMIFKKVEAVKIE